MGTHTVAQECNVVFSLRSAFFSKALVPARGAFRCFHSPYGVGYDFSPPPPPRHVGGSREIYDVVKAGNYLIIGNLSVLVLQYMFLTGIRICSNYYK